jgi:cytosine permease
MTTKHDLVQAESNYLRKKVPQNKTYSGFHIALIMIGGTISIPNFYMAAEVGLSLGLSASALAFAAGALVLGILAMLTSLAGVKSHYSTYMIIKFAFGEQGGRLVNFLIAITLIGWYGVILNVFAQASFSVIDSISDVYVPTWIYVICGSILMIGVTINGFKGLDKLALVLVPFMLFFLGYAAWLTWEQALAWVPDDSVQSFSFSSAASAVIGGYILGVVIQPDYTRYARNTRHAMAAAFFAMAVSFPLVMILIAIPSIASQQADLIKIMLALGIGVPAFLLVILAAWSSNVLCIYSSSLAVATIFTKRRLNEIVIGLGILGTAIAFSGAENYIIEYLVLLGISVPPVAAIFALNILWIRKGICDEASLIMEPVVDKIAFISWGLALVVGYGSHIEIFSLTNVAGLDSCLAAFFIYPLLKFVFSGHYGFSKSIERS